MPSYAQITKSKSILQKEKGVVMDTNMIVRIVAGVLAVIVLVVIIQRRRTRVK